MKFRVTLTLQFVEYILEIFSDDSCSNPQWEIENVQIVDTADA